MAYIDTGAYDKWLRERQQQELTNRYNAEKAALDQKYENGGLGGFLGNIVGGIGKGIGDIGYSLGGMFGEAGASLKDIFEGKINTGENTKAFKRTYYGAKDDKDAAAKAAGNALNAATNLATVVAPGVAGAGTAAGKVLGGAIANTAAGAIGGVADEFAQQGSDARLDSAVNRAISGAVAGAVTGKLGNKIGNAKSALGKTLLNNKIATSTIGRGALSGALGGATGAGTSAALSGGDVLGEAIEGAKSGAISGGVQAGVTSAAKSIASAAGGKRIQNRWEKQQDRNFENAIKNPSSVKENVYLGELSDKNYNDVANVLNKVGLTTADGDTAITVKNNAMYLTPEGAQHLYERRIQNNNIAPETVRQVMRNATSGVVLDTPSRANNAVMGVMNSDGRKVDIAYLGPTQEGNLSLASVYPEKSGATSRAIKNTLDASQTRRTTGDTSLAAGNISALQGIDNSIAQDSGNVNDVDEYGMRHRPTKTGVLANDLNNSAGRTDLEVWGPNDVYDNPQYYATAGSKEANAETSNIVKSLKGASPDKEITIYRATPGNSINDGDWVTLSKQYAIDHNNSQLDGKGNVVEMKVPLKDVQWAGDDLNEWGYFPQKQKYYHGTPDGTFTEFRDGSYFTTDSEYAKKYMSPQASEIGTGKKEINPMVYETELNMKKPFDIVNDPEARKIYIEEYIKGGNAIGINPYMSDTEYDNIKDIDWTEVQDLSDFLANKGYKYDAIVGNEGGYFDENGNVVDRGRSVKLFNGKDAVLSPSTLERVNAFNNQKQATQALVNEPTALNAGEPTLRDYTTPVDYQGNRLKIRNKNFIEKAGDVLANAGEAIQNRELYNSLYSKTANKMVRNGSIDKLRAIGFEPSDYGEAAKISTTTNQFVDDIVKNSGAKVNDPDFAGRILTPGEDIVISDANYQKKYDTQVRNLLDRIETGDFPGQYSASDLLKESRRFGDLANDWRKKSVNVNGDVTNRDGYELASAYTDVKYALRDLASEAVDGFGDNYTKKQLGERLKKLGAPQKAIDYILEADNIGGFIRNTALFEDARQMSREMKETALRRNAVAGRSNSPFTVIANAAGVPQLLEAAASPVGKIAGGVAKTVGNVAQEIGAKLPEGGQSALTPEQQLLLGNFLGRTEGQRQNNRINTEIEKARDYQNLEQLLAEAQALEATPTQQNQPSPTAIKLQSQISQMNGMMEQALAAGDFTSYNKLQSLYNQLYNAYKNEMPQTEETLTTTQKNKLVKLQNASNALDELEQLYSNAGGAQGFGGNLSSWLSNVGLNNNLSNYNQSAKTLLNQISSAVGSTVSADLIPRSTDSKEEAKNKIATLRRLIDQASGNYNSVYGM